MSPKFPKQAPDSQASPVDSITVRDTDSDDFPQFGQVTIRIQHNRNQSNTVRLTLADAHRLAADLAAYIKGKSA